VAAASPGHVRALAGHFGVYVIGSLLSLVCSVALLPIYASQFSPAQFGFLAMGQLVAFAAVGIVRAGIHIGMFRFLVVYHANGDAKSANAIVTSSLAATIAVAIIAAIAAGAALQAFGARFFGQELALLGQVIALNMVFSAPREVAELALRAKQRPVGYVGLSSSFLLLSTALTALFIVGFHGGVTSVFVATLIANGLTSVIAIVAVSENLALNAFSSRQLLKALRFGLPSVPALFADWVTQYSDRLFLTRFAGLAQVGVYSFGYRIGLIEQQVLGTASQAAWDPFVLRTYGGSDGATVIGRVATYFALAGMAIAILLSSAAPSIMLLGHARREYSAATTIVFLIALANFFGLMQYLFLAPTSIALRPEFGTLLRGVAAAINVALNFWLISKYGMLGAAWATLLTFLVSAVLTQMVGRRLWRIAFEWRRLATIVLMGLVTQEFVSLAQSYGLLSPPGMLTAASEGIFGILIVGGGFFSRHQLRQLPQLVRRLVRTTQIHPSKFD